MIDPTNKKCTCNPRDTCVCWIPWKPRIEPPKAEPLSEASKAFNHLAGRILSRHSRLPLPQE